MYTWTVPYFILVSDGDAKLASGLAAAIRDEFEVATCELARQAFEHLRSARPPDLIIVDYDIPDMDCLTFLGVVREMDLGKDLPVILTGTGKSEESVVQAFQAGIDDFLEKPFDNREMRVRIRAVLRRKYERQERPDSTLAIGGVEINPTQRRCIVHGKRVRLQPKEFDLLEILMRKAGRVLTRVYLLETVWGLNAAVQTRAVDVMMSRLRKRLGRRSGRLIETVSKMGYCFLDPAEGD